MPLKPVIGYVTTPNSAVSMRDITFPEEDKRKTVR